MKVHKVHHAYDAIIDKRFDSIHKIFPLQDELDFVTEPESPTHRIRCSLLNENRARS